MYRLVLLLLASTITQAQTQHLKTNTHTLQPIQHNTDGKTQNTLNKDLFNRDQWQLDETEWQRYKDLMKGIRGSISPDNLSPVEVLGTHARNDEERNKYARIWARMMFEDAGRILDFQRAYNIAFNDMYGHIPLIDVTKLGLAKNQLNNIQKHDRLLAFIKLEDCPQCGIIIRQLLLKTQTLDVQVDVFFMDTRTKEDNQRIRDWANQHIINKQRLKSGKITLNHDKGKLFRLTNSPVTAVPIMFRTNDKETVQVFL